MIEKTTYIADDGMEFEDYNECVMHETITKHYDKVQAFSTDGLNSFGTDFADCDFVIIEDAEQGEQFAQWVSEMYGYCVPKKVGKWYYNSDIEDWVDYQEIVEIYQKCKSIFER